MGSRILCGRLGDWARSIVRFGKELTTSVLARIADGQIIPSSVLVIPMLQTEIKQKLKDKRNQGGAKVFTFLAQDAPDQLISSFI